jgi:hypothetical protein
MGLRLVDDGSSSGDDRAALADARRSASDARQRLLAVADRLADLRRRLGEGGSHGNVPGGESTATTGYRSPGSSD